MRFPSWEAHKWKDLAENPLIGPVSGTEPRHVVGDPQVILPGEFDDRWHMFVIGEGRFYRFDSTDGITWKLVSNLDWRSGPMCVTSDGTQWIAYYTHCIEGECVISARTSTDLTTWCEPTTLITPEFDWEREGRRIQVRNPNVIILPDGRYRMYYSGGTVWLDDCGYEEPKYIGYAESDHPLESFSKNPVPILTPQTDLPHRNFGAGAIKVFKLADAYLGLMNGMYRDEKGASRSAIDVVMSVDGITWHEAPYNPIIAPTAGWKKALVYQLDLRYFQRKLWLFYNARDEWLDGVEWIGCSMLDWAGQAPEKLWRLPQKTEQGTPADADKPRR